MGWVTQWITGSEYRVVEPFENHLRAACTDLPGINARAFADELMNGCQEFAVDSG